MSSLFMLATLALLQAQPSALPSINRLSEDVNFKIISSATNSTAGWERLAHLCDYFPGRLSGSTNLELGIDWILEELRKDRFDNVHGEDVLVPVWVRGEESATVLRPREYKLRMLGLGGSVATPPDGITAEVLVVQNFEDLSAQSERARGKIVLFNTLFTSYEQVVKIRSRGAIEASKAGAVASLIRSLTPYSMRTAHTGMMRYDEAVPKIPHAAISPEDADWIDRMAHRGEKVMLNLKMGAHSLASRKSRNVIAELRGRTEPDEYFLLSAHLDSWDVGQGAMDDGGGCLAVWEALRQLKTLNLMPRRSLRLVLFTNEENGVAGARTYFQQHTNDLSKYIMAFETDEGVFEPKAFRYTGPDSGKKLLQEILYSLKSFAPLELLPNADATDLIFMKEKNVPCLDLVVEGSKYFWFHHTEADTLDKLTLSEFNRCVAVIAAVAWAYSDHYPPVLEP